MKFSKLVVVFLLVLCLVGCGGKEAENEHEHEYEKGICDCGEIEEGYYKITFKTDSDSRVKSQIIKKGDFVTIPEKPIKKGYIFGGWYYKDAEFDFGTAVNNNITLKAKWLYESCYEVNKISNITNIKINCCLSNIPYCEINFAPLEQIVAPGSSGIIQFLIKNYEEVKLLYKLKLECNLEFLTFAKDENFLEIIDDEGIDRYFLSDLDPDGTDVLTIYWRWSFDGDDDYLDTNLGLDMNELKMQMFCEIEQAD